MGGIKIALWGGFATSGEGGWGDDVEGREAIKSKAFLVDEPGGNG